MAKIKFLDACYFEEKIDEIEQLIKTGNFRITTANLKEVKAWREPSRFAHPLKRKIWQRAQAAVKEIETRWPDHIDNVSKGVIYRELMELVPILSKTIAFNQIFPNIDKIITIIALDSGINLRKFAGMLFNQFAPEVEGKFSELCKSPPSGDFTIINKEEDIDIAKKNLSKAINHIIHYIYELLHVERRARDDVKEMVRGKFGKSAENDVIGVTNYLTHPIGKKGRGEIASIDTDWIELISLLRRKKAA